MEKEKEIQHGIRHSGVVLSVDGKRVRVTIVAQSACASCHMKSACSASDTKEKIVEAVCSDDRSLSVGDEVDVIISQSNGYIAVLMSYIVPVILILASIIVAVKMGYSESMGGVVGLVVVILYFMVIYLLRNKIDKKLVIEVVSKEK